MTTSIITSPDNLDKAAHRYATYVLEDRQCSVAEALQELMHARSLPENCQAVVDYFETIINEVCARIDEDQAVL
jgi:recombinational DNA repair protein RecR